VFSGIIDQIGVIRRASDTPNGRVLAVEAPDYWHDLPIGASVAIDGVCLTLTKADGSIASFDVIAETLRRSTLGRLRAGDRVNLQKSMAVGDRIDGHFVQGHVDAVAEVAAVERTTAEAVWWFAPGDDAMRYMVPKGSVAVDGISLTIAAVEPNRFSVALIPTTLERTTLGEKRIGAQVNIETDILARSLAHLMQRMSADAPPGITPEFLRESGFDASRPEPR